MSPSVAALTPVEAVDLLRPRFGDLQWRPHHDPISELVLTILSQHTNDTLSGKAFIKLTSTFCDWQAIADAPAETVIAAIRDGGLANQKGPRIQQVLRQVAAERGGFDLTFLETLPLPEAKAWLQRLPGVGPKTAACVLMFALGRPALPVDTHVYRVSQRLGWLNAKVSEAKAHAVLEPLLPEEAVYPFHVAMIKHGRHTCSARAPACAGCVLRRRCPSAVQTEAGPAGAMSATGLGDEST